MLADPRLEGGLADHRLGHEDDVPLLAGLQVDPRLLHVGAGERDWSGARPPGSRPPTGRGLVTLTTPISRVDGDALTEISCVWLDWASLLSRVISRMAGLAGSWYSAIRATTQ